MVGKTVVEAPDYASVDEPVKQQLAQLLSSYLELKDALVASDSQAAKAEAQAILAGAVKMAVAALAAEQQQFATEKLEKVEQSASEIADAADVSTKRKYLEPLSEATFALTKAFDATNQKLYYQHCPMANNS